MNCAAVERCLDAVLDEEVDPSTRIAVDQHVATCAACDERIAFARWLKNRLRSDAKLAAPAALRERVEHALERERSPFSSLRLDGSWRATAAMAAMALLVFGVGGALQLKGQRSVAAMAPLFEDVVRAHTRSYPAEVAQREQVPAYFAERVGFAVQPVDFRDPGVRFVGARHAEVGGRHAVTLQYEARGRPMTVVAFKPPADAIEQAGGGEVDQEGRHLRYVQVGRHVVPLVEHRGVVYAVVGDLELEDALRLAAQATLR
jgi:anti-sigma factor RsiW